MRFQFDHILIIIFILIIHNLFRQRGKILGYPGRQYQSTIDVYKRINFKMLKKIGWLVEERFTHLCCVRYIISCHWLWWRNGSLVRIHGTGSERGLSLGGNLGLSGNLRLRWKENEWVSKSLIMCVTRHALLTLICVVTGWLLTWHPRLLCGHDLWWRAVGLVPPIWCWYFSFLLWGMKTFDSNRMPQSKLLV